MAATSRVFPMASDSLAQKKIDVDSDTLKVMLLSAYAYAATHQYVSAVKAAGTESSDADYTAGGVALSLVTWTRSGDVYTLDAADVTWASTVDAVAAVVYDSTPGTDATNPVLVYVNLNGGSTVAVPGISWASTGIATLTAS